MKKQNKMDKNARKARDEMETKATSSTYFSLPECATGTEINRVDNKQIEPELLASM